MTTHSLLAALLCTGVGAAETGPYLAPGHDPVPAGTAWERVEALSDEFDGEALDLAKWQSEPVANGWVWEGRPPALFKASNVTLRDGMMAVTVGKLDEPVIRGERRYTHQGAIVRSLQPGQVGWYYECRMKANATEMSSTFWLMSKEADPNAVKKLEMDIQECVGRTTDLTHSWAKRWDRIFHSNLIHRTNRHNPEEARSQGAKPTETRNWERFYVYGAWWKSPEEILFFLDGELAYTLRPPIAWDVPAFIQMAIETYDWNPIPPDGGLVESGTRAQRTTLYDWVRTWRLQDDAEAASPAE